MCTQQSYESGGVCVYSTFSPRYVCWWWCFLFVFYSRIASIWFKHEVFTGFHHKIIVNIFVALSIGRMFYPRGVDFVYRLKRMRSTAKMIIVNTQTRLLLLILLLNSFYATDIEFHPWFKHSNENWTANVKIECVVLFRWCTALY